MKYLIKIDGTCDNRPCDIGGKAYNLNILRKHGFKVPVSYVIPVSFYKKYFDQELTSDQISLANVAEISSQMQKAINNQEFVEPMRNDLQRLIDTVSLNKLAVRSSATLEDSEEKSFAGQFDSVLNVPLQIQELLEAIKSVYKSLYSVRALAYCVANNINIVNLHMSVVLQEMIVKPEVAGTIFTFNIKNNSKQQLCIQAVKGLGDKVVDGSGEVVTYNIHRANIKEELAKLSSPIVSTSVLEKLLNKALDIEKIYDGRFQDIEWAAKNGDIFLLQTRAITTVVD
jgi:pyruvate,water dikinase